MTEAKVELGRRLFYDARMSVNGKGSCATCHRQELAFTDGRTVSVGVTGESHARSAMSLVNVAYSGALTWSDPRLKRLEEQALTPMYGEHPVELGLREADGFLPTLNSDADYRATFARAFPGESDPISTADVTKALACFERSILSARSPYDGTTMAGMTTLFPRPQNAARSSSSISAIPVSAATVVLISAPTPFPGAIRTAKSNFITRASITRPVRFRIRRRTSEFMNTRKRQRMSGSSRRRRCATLP